MTITIGCRCPWCCGPLQCFCLSGPHIAKPRAQTAPTAPTTQSAKVILLLLAIAGTTSPGHQQKHIATGSQCSDVFVSQLRMGYLICLLCPSARFSSMLAQFTLAWVIFSAPFAPATPVVPAARSQVLEQVPSFLINGNFMVFDGFWIII